MKLMALISMTMVLGSVHAWDSIAEMEKDFCLALTNREYLLNATFTNRLAGATNMAISDCQCEAAMLSSVHAAQSFAETADAIWLQEEMRHASNAVAVIGPQTGKWQYWMSRVIYAGACASQSNYEESFCTMTNALHEIASSGFTNAVSPVGRLLLKKFEMPDIDICEAMKVMAGMSAAVTGNGSVATNYANQVPVPYKDTILEFVQ